MNITTIVDQLLESPINEESEDMFLSQIKAENVDVIGAENQTVANASLMVKWRADSEYRSWGIKSIDPVIESVSGWIDLETIEDNAKSSTIKLEGFVADAKVETAERSGLYLYPHSAEINVRTRSVLVRF
jgi:hypothetical protein